LSHSLSAPPNFFFLFIFQVRSRVFAQGQPQTLILQTVVSHTAGIQVCSIPGLLVEVGSCWLFALAGLEPQCYWSVPPE
jgi:hypothetical protein